MHPAAADILTPQLGRYQVLKHLATGGMAQVYLARASGIEGFERYVVVKRILPDHVKNQRFVKMFLDEARLAACLHHQNVVQVYDIGQEGEEYFFAMEYVHGEDVRELLRKAASLRRYVPWEHALSVIAGAAAGLDYAHTKVGNDKQPLGIVHRDVSPSNIIVGYDGSVKVVDFGIAKAATRVAETRSGTLKGKIAYMSPEQCRGKGIDARSDVFALGIVMYELTTITRLFKGENDYITMNRIATGDVPLPSSKRADFPPALEAIIMKSLSLDPDGRFQSAGEMLRAIDEYASEARLSMSTPGLARYVKELFGEKPEPWLNLGGSGSDYDDVQVDVTNSQVDVDGAPAAVVPRPAHVETRTTGPTSLSQQFGASHTAQTTPFPASSSVAAPPRSRAPWIALGLAVAALGTVAAIVLGSSDRGDDAPPAGGTIEPVSAPPAEARAEPPVPVPVPTPAAIPVDAAAAPVVVSDIPDEAKPPAAAPAESTRRSGGSRAGSKSKDPKRGSAKEVEATVKEPVVPPPPVETGKKRSPLLPPE